MQSGRGRRETLAMGDILKTDGDSVKDPFEVLRRKVRCEYISDLRSECYYPTALQKIKELDSKDFSAAEWQDLMEYMREVRQINKP